MIESLFVFACRRRFLPAAWHLCLVLCGLGGWSDLCRAYRLVVHLNGGAEDGRNQHGVRPKCLFDNMGIESGQRFRANDDVLENLVDGVTDMDVAVGVGWAVVEYETSKIGRASCRERV